MRNWNTLVIPTGVVRAKSFEPTYEELKPLLWPLQLGLPPSFWAYLWGIETRKKDTARDLISPVLSLPMRNWNLCNFINTYVFWWKFWAYLWGIETWSACLSVESSAASFEPTYEELKLCHSSLSFTYLTCFEPTYEELKLLVLTRLNRLQGCFEPTYEELKHHNIKPLEVISNRVLSLPMRNWNRIC